MSGDWMLMAHGTLNLVYDHQAGPRGDDKAFASGMLMGMAQHPLGNGTLQFKAMISPDPLMGPRGYPLLLASGETANGADRLIDRQHPHDLFMELSASASQTIGRNSSVFVYGGLPGEPAFGPPAFMHREAIMDSPEAPITHHWLGFDAHQLRRGHRRAGRSASVKMEASRFNGREPDQHRWDIETGPLNSTSVRMSWNPTRTLALQGSWGRFIDPEQLEPGVGQTRWSASALWADSVAPGWKAAATLAWGARSAQGHSDDGVAVEGSLKHARSWTLFGRGEMVEPRGIRGRRGWSGLPGRQDVGRGHSRFPGRRSPSGAHWRPRVARLRSGCASRAGVWGLQPTGRDGVRADEARLSRERAVAKIVGTLFVAVLLILAAAALCHIWVGILA